MKTHLRALGELQELDLKLKKMEETLTLYPEQITRYNRELEELRQSVLSLKERLSQQVKEKASLEIRLAESSEAIRKAEERLFVIKTHKEFVALEKEIAEAKKTRSEIEDEMLRSIETIENLQREIDELDGILKAKEAEYEEKIKALTEELEVVRTTYDATRKERDRVASAIRPEFLAIYNRVRGRNGRGIVEARGQVCQGCFMNIPPQLYNEVVMNSKLIQCPHCQRILYYDAEKENTAATA
jgi:predicted  nucleic acid-binding Zn-ribbon protein